MKDINDDKKLAMESRKNTLQGEDGVEVSLVDKSPKKLLTKLRDEDFGEMIRNMWTQGNSERAPWLTRQEAYLQEYDEFIDPIVDAPSSWAADLHLPIILTIGKTFHARFYAAVLGQDPVCSVKARKAANEDRTALVQDVMNYASKTWSNNGAGIEAEIDSFIWNWAMRGVGILKMSWERRYSRINDVVKEPISVLQYVTDPETGMDIPVEAVEYKDVEKDIIVEECNAPRIKRVAPEDLVIIGGNGDIDAADAVIEQTWLTASDLWTLVDQGVFNEEAVKRVISAGEDQMSGQINNGIKNLQVEKAGLTQLDNSFDLQRYQILEAYVKKDVDGSGINSDIVVWVHPQTGEILRATYLHRINKKTKRRPYAKADFYMREGQTYGIGLVELTYSLTKEIDALNNMALDFGLLSSMPFGYYRSGSRLTEEAIPIEPGSLIPIDDPSSIVFPNLGNRSAFSLQYLQFLYSIIERLTGINDLTLGVIAGQGVTRTASGVSALVSESNANLDIFLRRLNRALKKMFSYTFAMIQEKMPEGLEFRIFGQNGQDYFRQIKSRNEIGGEFDFELEPNSANSNPTLRLQSASQILQLTANPLDIQLGIITPAQRYEALKNYLVAMGVRDFNKYIQLPPQARRVLTPEEAVSRILAGLDVPISPDMDLQGLLSYGQQIMDDDMLLGQFNEQQAVALGSKLREAGQMMAALQEMAAQQANANQMQMNAAQSMQQTMQQAAPAPAPQAPEGQ